MYVYLDIFFYISARWTVPFFVTPWHPISLVWYCKLQVLRIYFSCNVRLTKLCHFPSSMCNQIVLFHSGKRIYKFPHHRLVRTQQKKKKMYHQQASLPTSVNGTFELTDFNCLVSIDGTDHFKCLLDSSNRFWLLNHHGKVLTMEDPHIISITIL